MKLLSIITLLFLCIDTYSQYDEACVNTLESYVYEPNIILNSSYNWIIDKNDVKYYTISNDTIYIKWNDVSGVKKLGIYEMSDYGCIGDTTWLYVKINDYNKYLNKEYELCQNDTLSINLDDNLFTNTIWDDSLYNNTYINKFDSSTYIKIKSNYSQCIINDSVYVNVHNKPIADIIVNNVSTDSLELCKDYTLENKTYENYYNWSYNNNDFYSDKLDLKESDNYKGIVYLKTTNEYCENIDSLRIFACNDNISKLYIPHIFTPNNDGVNDTWVIENLDLYDNYEISVYDRWGRIVFYSYNDYKPWSGDNLPMDSYMYIIHIDDLLLIEYVTIIR